MGTRFCGLTVNRLAIPVHYSIYVNVAQLNNNVHDSTSSIINLQAKYSTECLYIYRIFRQKSKYFVKNRILIKKLNNHIFYSDVENYLSHEYASPV